jgi:hypothetical protein
LPKEHDIDFVFDDLSEEIRVWMDIHDTKTNRNWTAVLFGTVAEIFSVWQKSGKLMDDAGFVPGWRAGGTYCGSIDYIVLASEAEERCWPSFFEAAPATVHHCPSSWLMASAAIWSPSGQRARRPKRRSTAAPGRAVRHRLVFSLLDIHQHLFICNIAICAARW